jgi:transcriptional regulator with PAS, ATPase and Fis domain
LFPGEHPTFFPIGQEATVGRDPSCQVVLDAGQVSRRHLVIRRNGPVTVAEDLGSRNGSYCDGKLFAKTSLAHQSVLRVGAAVLLWHAADRAPSHFSELAPGLLGGTTLAARLAQLQNLAASRLSVILRGASGCGKERVARALHAGSGRAGRFIGVNCATIPEQLADSQLFGHKRGAFTGAERGEAGYLAAADGGTLFLDEVLELSAAVQAKLLRALQEREFVPVGETKAVPFDARVLVSTQTSLSDAAARGRFREDLFARLNGYEITLPLLRERREDIVFLFRHFLTSAYGGTAPRLGARAVEALSTYAWPQNVRELENLAQRVCVLYPEATEVHLDQLSRELQTGGVDPARATRSDTQPELPDSQPQDLRKLLSALSAREGNVVKVAEELGISRARAYRWIAAAGIDVQRFRKRAPLRS